MIVERLNLALVAAEAAVGDERQNLLKQLPWDGDLGDLEGDTASMADDLRADLNQLFLQARQRPVLDRLRRRQRPQTTTFSAGLAMLVTMKPTRG